MVSKINNKPKPIIYYGLNIEDQKRQDIKDIILKGLSEIELAYPSTVEEITSIKSIIQQPIPKPIKSLWSFPNTYHVTTLFKGRSGFDKTKLPFKEFEENKGVELTIHGLIYIPKKIITLIIFTTQAVDNKFPHITGLIAEYKPKNSNDVCNALFNDGMIYENVYKVMKAKQDIKLIDEFSQKILDKEVTGYINVFKPQTMSASMKGFTF